MFINKYQKRANRIDVILSLSWEPELQKTMHYHYKAELINIIKMILTKLCSKWLDDLS